MQFFQFYLLKKPGGGLRFYINSRDLNFVIVKNRYSLSLISETLNRLCKTKIYIKFDIITAFNRL